nr:putative ribonuclease h protein [Quercus suber]
MAYLGIIEKHVKTKTKIQVRWLPPPFSWVKLNSDESSMGNPDLAGGGGLIRNENVEWIKGYARAISCATSVAAKLWALRDGIQLCISLKVPAVVFELDAKLVIELLKKDMENPNGVGILVADCKEWMKKIPLVRIQHCYREANKRADVLACSHAGELL